MGNEALERLKTQYFLADNSENLPDDVWDWVNERFPMDAATFQKVAAWVTERLSPKNGGNRIVEFGAVIGDRPYRLRAYAPANYRRIWLYVSEDETKDRMAKSSYGSDPAKRFGNWFQVANHDSAWPEGFNLEHLVPGVTWETPYHLKEIAWGEVRGSEEGMQDYPTCTHEEQFVRLQNRASLVNVASMFDLLVWLVPLLYEEGDRLVFRFAERLLTGDMRHRAIEMVDEETCTVSDQERHSEDEAKKQVMFTAEALARAFGPGEWRLRTIDHVRPGVGFM